MGHVGSTCKRRLEALAIQGHRGANIFGILAGALLSVGLGCGGDGPDWEPGIDPLAQVSSAAVLPVEPEPIGLARLERDVAEGTVSLADSYRYRLAQIVDYDVEVPDEYVATEDQPISDLILEDLQRDIEGMSEADRADLLIWTESWFHPLHPMNPFPALRKLEQSDVGAAGDTGFLAALDRDRRARWPTDRIRWAPPLLLVPPRTVLPMAKGASPRAPRAGGIVSDLDCPQDPLVRGIWRPPAIDSGDVVFSDSDFLMPLAYCVAKLNDHIILSWPFIDLGDAGLEGPEISAIANAVAARATESFSAFLGIFSTMASEFIYRSGEESIVIGLFPQTGRPAAHPSGDRTYIYLPMYADLETMREHVVPHEMFHAFQQRLRDATPQEPRKWIIEGMADWGSKRVSGKNRAGNFVHHRNMERLLGYDPLGIGIHKGITSLKYPVHLYWHEMVRRQGEQQLKGAILMHQLTGLNYDVFETMELPNLWHDFARNLYHKDPWKSMADAPEDFPTDWEISVKGPHFVDVTWPYFVVTPINLPKVSVIRSKFAMGEDQGYAYIQLHLDYEDDSPAHEGLEYSVIFPNTQEEIHLEVGEYETICFDGNEPICEDEQIYQRDSQMDLIISSWNHLQEYTKANLIVSTIPIRMKATKIKVGDTESDITGNLTMTRKEDDQIVFEADELWFEFEDEVYNRMIPDEPVGGSGRANISEDLIREYIKDNAEFRGEQELKFEVNEEADPVQEDGKWWAELKTEREEGDNFFSTPHRFFIKLDPAWFEALGGGTGVMGPGGIVFQRMIYRLNRHEFPEGSFAHTLQAWFTQAMTLGTASGGEGKPRYTVDNDTHELLFKMGNVTLWLEAEQ